MIRHEAIGMDLPARLAARIAQGLDNAPAVAVIVEDEFAPVPTVHDCGTRPPVVNPTFARHTHTVWRNPVRQTKCQNANDK